MLARELKRGKVDCRISLNRTTPGAAALAVNAERVVQLRDAASEVLRHAPGSAPLSTVEILRWPGVLDRTLGRRRARWPRRRCCWYGRRCAIWPHRARAKARKLRDDARGTLPAASRHSWRASRRACRRSTTPMSRSSARACAKPASIPTTTGSSRSWRCSPTKIDVAEEVSRLRTHVAEVRRVLAAGGSSGKRLDFLMQELNREANTLGSKSVDAELSHVALELKVLIEQMREQVQNIE